MQAKDSNLNAVEKIFETPKTSFRVLSKSFRFIFHIHIVAKITMHYIRLIWTISVDVEPENGKNEIT